MSDVLRAVEEIVDVLCKHLGPQVLNQDTASDIDIDRHDDFRNEMQEVAADIVAIPTLRAALAPEHSVTELTTPGGVTFSKYAPLGESIPLAPVTDEEVAGIAERHEELKRLGHLAHHDWASEAHTDRATLLRRDAQREAELAAVKAERYRAQRACEQMGARITAMEAALAIYETCADDCIKKSHVFRQGACCRSHNDCSKPRPRRAQPGARKGGSSWVRERS